MTKSTRSLKTILPLLTVALFCLPGECPAVRPYQPIYVDPMLEPWRWRVFDELKGLGLRCLAEGKDGTMFFGIDEGVRHYDGKTWTVYSAQDGLPDAPVNVLFTAQDGRVYAGTDWGVSRFEEGRWHKVFPQREDLPCPVDRIRQVKDGSLWVATAWGALHLQQDGAQVYTTREMGAALQVLAPEIDVSIIPAAAAPFRPWGQGMGIRVIKGRYLSIARGKVPMVIWALAPGGPGEQAGLKVGDHIHMIDDQPYFSLQAPVGTSTALLIERDGLPGPFEVTVTHAALEGGVRDFSLGDLLESHEGALWFGLAWAGEMLRYDPARGGVEDETVWRLYTAADGLKPAESPRIVQTRDGVIWAVSNHKQAGLNRFDGHVWTHLDLDALGGNNIATAILETRDGTLWIGGHFGHLLAYRDGHWTVYGSLDIPTPTTRMADLGSVRK